MIDDCRRTYRQVHFPLREKLFETRQPIDTASTASSPTSSLSSASTCPRCGFGSPTSSAATSPTASTHGDDATSLADAQHQIQELRLQVRNLNEKAALAVEKWTGYEDELAMLRRQLKSTSQRSVSAAPSRRGIWNKTPDVPRPMSRVDKTTDDLLVVLSREQQLRVTGDQTMDDLLVALTREQQLRVAAEEREHDASREVEELSATLFEEANEMVATERRARAKLEERVDVLEKRDLDKRRRLERLELAVGRIERVKRLLEET